MTNIEHLFTTQGYVYAVEYKRNGKLKIDIVGNEYSAERYKRILSMKPWIKDIKTYKVNKPQEEQE